LAWAATWPQPWPGGPWPEEGAEKVQQKRGAGPLGRRAPPPQWALAARLTALDWPALAAALDAHGCATTGPLLTPAECGALRDLYRADAPFRSRIIMAWHGFGRGEEKYFAYPLPETAASLRAMLYAALAEVSNRWDDAVGLGVRSPPTHAA